MRHGCDKRCPKVREQLRKSREEGREETYDEDSSSAGPSTGQKTKNEISKRSKQRPKGFPSDHAEPGRSADGSRRSDPDLESYRGSHDSELTVKKHLSSERKKTGASPKSPQKGRIDPTGNKSRTSGRSDAVRRTPDHGKGVKRGDDEERAGPSRKTRSRKEEGEHGGESEDHPRKWPTGAHDRCEPHCSIHNERMRESEDKKPPKETDDYVLQKNLHYFEDLCSCCRECLTNQLWKDQFVKSTVASVGVFALGLKLCWDMDGWTIPNLL